MKKPTYESIAREREDVENAIDRVISKRTKSKARDRRVAKLSNAIVEALGEQRDLWFAYERLLCDRTLEREAVAFDVGVEHGAAWARAEAAAPAARAVRRVARDIATHVLAADLPREDAISALVSATWALVGAAPKRVSNPKKRKGQK